MTPARRVAGRAVTTVDGLDQDVRDRWASAFVDTGASQCGFCTPGIIMRLAALEQKGPLERQATSSALLAHLCRCTGWRTILEAAEVATSPASPASGPSASGARVSPRRRDLAAAARRATIEGRTPQAVGDTVALGGGGFSDDGAPADALVAVPEPAGGWAVGETLSEARARAGKVQGRHSTLDVTWPLAVPDGEWALRLATTWVEPGYLETDASWCAPGGAPATPLANGGAFGGKVASVAAAAARRLADEHGRAVRVLLSREDVVRLGPKRPPLAVGVRDDGTGIVRVVRTEGIAAAIASACPGLVVEPVDVAGPPTSVAVRAAGWAEAAVLLGVLDARRRGSATVVVRSPEGAEAEAEVEPGGDDGAGAGRIRVSVRCGDPLDAVVLRSYCIGAAHMALGWVRSEAIAVDDQGRVHDLTIRSFGILRARDTPEIEVDVADGDGEPVNGSDAVLAAVAGAAWLAAGLPERWPCARGAIR